MHMVVSRDNSKLGSRGQLENSLQRGRDDVSDEESRPSLYREWSRGKSGHAPWR